MGLPMWGSAPENGCSSRGGCEETPQSFAGSFRMPQIASSNSPSLRLTTSVAAPEPVVVSSQIVTVSTREPIVVSSQSVNPSPPATSRGNGRVAGSNDGVGLRGARRNSDERDEQMLSLEEFLAETSRATARRIEMEEEDSDLTGHAGPARPERVAANADSTDDLGVIGSGIPSTRARTTPRQWQTSAATSSSSRRQLSRNAARLPPPPSMMRPNTETAAMASWNNFARQAGRSQETPTQIETPLQLAVAGGPTGFFDVVRRIRDIGNLQDALLEPRLREPDIIHAGEGESRRTRLSEAQRSSRLRAFQSRLDLISSEFELLRANRIELSRLERDAVNTLQSLSVRTQSAPAQPRPTISTNMVPTSTLIQMTQMEQATRIRRDLDRIDEETRNLRHAILPEHPLTLPTNNSPRIHADVERLVPRPISPPLVDFDIPDRTTQLSTSQPLRQEILTGMVPLHQRGQSEVSDQRIDRQSEFATQPSARPPDSIASEENQTPEPDLALSLREAWTQLDQPGLSEMEQLQLQVNIQRLIGQRARRLLGQRAQDVDNRPRNSTDTRLDTAPRPSRSVNAYDSPRHWTRSSTASVHEPAPPPSATAAPPTGETREISRSLRRQPDHINQQREVVGSFYRQFQRA